MDEKKEILLRRVQIIVAILAGLATIIVGVYNIRKLSRPEPEPVPPAQNFQPAPPPGAKLKSALEDVGASWLKKKLAPETESQ